MSETYSLSKIIKAVLAENGIKDTASQDAAERQLRRAFDSLLACTNAQKDILKKGGKNLQFKEDELLFIKALLSQLYLQKGTAYKIISKKERSFSSQDIMDLIQSIINEIDQTQLSQDKLKEVALFYARLFGYFPADLIEQCHQLVDAFALNLQDFPFEEQVLYLNKFLRTLKHEFILRIVESTINMRDIAEIITADNDEGEIPYSFCCPEVRETYIKRDKNVLEKIQQDPNLRTYIETSFGRKVEEIFSYLNAE